jgi:hypothetical protein
VDKNYTLESNLLETQGQLVAILAQNQLLVQTAFGYVDEQLDTVEANLGIDQGREADLEDKDGNRVDIVGHQEALAMSLQDRVEDVGNANWRSPSRHSFFSHSTVNSTNNSKATIRQHTLRAKALTNIALVDKNYT